MTKPKRLNTTDERIYTARQRETLRINALVIFLSLPEGDQKEAMRVERNFLYSGRRSE